MKYMVVFTYGPLRTFVSKFVEAESIQAVVDLVQSEYPQPSIYVLDCLDDAEGARK